MLLALHPPDEVTNDAAATSENVTKDNERERSMDSSVLSNAQSWLDILWWVKLAAAGFVALGVVLEFGGDWVAKPFERIVEDARKLEIAGLEREAVSAKAEIAKANESAAKANERAAEARAETQRLKAQLAWRELSADQRQKLIDGLRGHDISLALMWFTGDPEATEFARQIKGALVAAGVNVNEVPMLAGSPLPSGLVLSGSEGPVAHVIVDAFANAGLPLTVGRLLPDFQLFVGTKPR